MTAEERKAQIEKVRKLRYTSQEIFAQKTGIKLDTYKKYLQGGNPEAKTLIAIADALDVSVDFVLGRTNHLHVDDEEIHQQTGLSYEAIRKLRSWTKKSKFLGNHRALWTKTINVLIEHTGFGSVIDELYSYLKVIPSSFRLSCSKQEYIYSKDEPEKVVDVEPIFTELGKYDDDEILITLDNGSSFLLNESVLAGAQLTNVTKSIQDLREAIWKEWKSKNRGEDDGKH